VNGCSGILRFTGEGETKNAAKGMAVMLGLLGWIHEKEYGRGMPNVVLHACSDMVERIIATKHKSWLAGLAPPKRR
jgi:hypothetical protein